MGQNHTGNLNVRAEFAGRFAFVLNTVSSDDATSVGGIGGADFWILG
jgi:hypothetical protein